MERVFSAPPDLIILNVAKPGDDGLELARRLHEHSQAPLLFWSDYTDRVRVHEACRFGALGYVVKPSSTVPVLAAIAAALALGRELARLHARESELASALATLRTSHEAVGVLLERQGLNRRAAYDALRGRAWARSRTTAATAEEILVASELLNLKCS